MNHQKGFTLVEVLVAGVLIAALGAGIIGLQYVLTQSQVFVWETSINIDQTNNSIRTLVRELRTAKASDTGAYALELTLDQEIVFYSDIDFDQETERVRYFFK